MSRKKSFSVGILVTLMALLPSSCVLAQNLDSTSITNYPVGTCVDIGGGQWQQLADGTWAPPDDKLNTCANGGLPANWLNNPNLNEFLGSGLGYSNPLAQRTSNYAWGTDYPGGYSTYQDYFLNCVLAQSIIARPECQGFPRIASLLPNNSPISFYGNNLIINTKIGGQQIAAAIPLSQKVTNILSSIGMGWTISQLLR